MIVTCANITIHQAANLLYSPFRSSQNKKNKENFSELKSRSTCNEVKENRQLLGMPIDTILSKIKAQFYFEEISKFVASSTSPSNQISKTRKEKRIFLSKKI